MYSIFWKWEMRKGTHLAMSMLAHAQPSLLRESCLSPISFFSRREATILTKFDAPDIFSKSEITCSHFGYHGNQNSKFVSLEELNAVHTTIQQRPPKIILFPKYLKNN